MAIMKNAYLFVLGYGIEWEGTDIDMAVPLVQSMEAQYPHLTMTCSFDLKFYNPKFQEQLETETKLVTVVMSKKGASEYRRVQGDMSRALRVKSCMNTLNHRGIWLIREANEKRFERGAVECTVVAANLYRLDTMIQ